MRTQTNSTEGTEGVVTAGVIVVAISGIALASGIYAASRRNVVNALNVNDVPPPTTTNIAA